MTALASLRVTALGPLRMTALAWLALHPLPATLCPLPITLYPLRHHLIAALPLVEAVHVTSHELLELGPHRRELLLQ